MSLQQTAKELNKKFGWNIVPMYYLRRDESGKKKSKLIEWQRYKSERYDLSEWQDSYTALMVITGKISDLTILDVDSEEALETILGIIGGELEDLAEHIVRTTKGYQLFYSYEPNLRTRIGIRDKVDFLNGGISFALPCNEGYEVIKSNPPKPMPDTLKDLIIDKDDGDIDVDFERLLRENSDMPYRSPLIYVIKDFLDASRIGAKLKNRLEAVFCTKAYKNYNLNDFKKNGIKNETIMYVGGIVASNPTVDKDTYLQFMTKWSEKVANIDLTLQSEQNHLKNRIKGNMKYFRFDEEWKAKAESLKNPTKLNTERKMWYDPEDDKYVIYEPHRKLIMRLAKGAFKDDVAREYNSKGEDRITPNDVDVTLIERRFETFDPTIDDEFFIDSRGLPMHNNFKRTPMLSHFLICNPRKEMPTLIGNIINHVYPIKAERDLFLHSLAYHMTYLQVSPTMFVLTGKSGTGKNTLLETILSKIYGDMHLTTSSDTMTGRFRNALKNKLLVFIDEVSEKSHKPTERGSTHNVIKQIVGNPWISIEGKGVDEKLYPNYAFYVMASNKDTPFKLEEGFDRRINITKTRDENIRELHWFPKGLNSNEVTQMIESEVKEFVEYLASLELDPNRYHSLIDNKQRTELIRSSVTTVDRYINAIVEHNIEALIELDHEFGEWFETNIIIPNRSYATIQELSYNLGDLANKVIKGLKDAEINYKNILINGKATRCLIVNPQGTHKPEDEYKKLLEEF